MSHATDRWGCLVCAVLTACGILLAALPAMAGPAEAVVLAIAGKTVSFRHDTTRAQLAAALGEVFPGETPSVATAERLQYDYQAVPGRGPVTLVFDFDANGGLDRVLLDAMCRQDNPVAGELIAWLGRQGVRGRKVRGGMVWKHAGFRFRLEAITGRGEDDAYRMEVVPDKP